MPPKKKNGHVEPGEQPRLPVPVPRKKDEPHSDGPPRVRRGAVERRTRETEVSVVIDLDGDGRAHIDTPIPFLNHMLEALAKHSLMDVRIAARGDVEVDPHHLVEDVGLCLGRALVEAVGDRLGMRRYGEASLPFDEALVRCHLDLGGRAAFVYKVAITPGRIGSFDVELCEVFFQAVAIEGRMNLHLVTEYGNNRHHLVEGCFKSFARALEQAVTIDRRRGHELASTKGVID